MRRHLIRDAEPHWTRPSPVAEPIGVVAYDFRP